MERLNGLQGETLDGRKFPESFIKTEKANIRRRKTAVKRIDDVVNRLESRQIFLEKK